MAVKHDSTRFLPSVLLARMKRLLSGLAAMVGMVVLVVVGTIGFNWLTYYSEYNELLREIRRHPGLQVVDAWRHEDVTLEDFGFAVRTERVTAFINIVDGSAIRRPSDRAKGIAFHFPREVRRDGNTVRFISRFIEFDSADWQQRGLPKVRTIAEMLPHFDVIAHSLFTNPPFTSTAGPLPDVITLGLATGPRRSKDALEPLSKLTF
jgi:hypothetical protein